MFFEVCNAANYLLNINKKRQNILKQNVANILKVIVTL